MSSRVVKYSDKGGKGMNMKRFNRAISMVLVVAFLGMVCVGDFAYAATATVYQKNTYDQAVNLNYANATPNNIDLTPKVQNAGTTVVNKTTGAVQSVGSGVKSWWNKITASGATSAVNATTVTNNGTTVVTTPVENTASSSAASSAASTASDTAAASSAASSASDTAAASTSGGQSTSFWSKLRNSVGEGAHKLGNAISGNSNNNTTTTTDSATTASSSTASTETAATAATTAPSRDTAVQSLVDDGTITVDKNGRAHWTAGSDKKGYVSNADLDTMVEQKSVEIQKQAAAQSTSTASGQTSSITRAEAMDRLGVVKKGNNYYVEKPVAKATVETMIQGKMTESGCTRAEAIDRLGITQDDGGNYKVSRAVKQSTVDQMVDDKMAENVASTSTTGSGDAATTEQGQSKFSKFKSDLADGYQSGMTNAKAITSATLDFRHGQAWQNLAITAGVTVGAKVLSNIANGQPADIKGAVGSIFTKEFAGGYVGGALGCAGGALAQGLLSAVPVVGPVIGAFMPALGGIIGGQLGSGLGGGLSLSEALSAIDPVQVTGQAIGSTIGAMLGSLIPIPVVGTMLGGMVGGWLGGKAATWIKGLFTGNTNVTTTTGGGKTDTGTTSGSTGGSTVSSDSFSAREAQVAYQDYISAYNKLTDLMTAGKGDTTEAQDAYQEYKSAKEKYESLTNALQK